MSSGPPIRAVELSCVIAGHSRRADKSLSIRLSTLMEASIELATWLDERKDQQVHVLIADDPEAQAKSYVGDRDRKGRTKSQVLRNQIYGAWKYLDDHGADVGSFNEYYDKEMDRLIESVRYGDE